MTHAEFRAAYARGEIRVDLEPRAAARFLSARLLLPLFAMPVAGAGVALALVGWIATGLALIAVAFIAPRLIKRSAPRFLLQNALEDALIYEELTQARILTVIPVERGSA